MFLENIFLSSSNNFIVNNMRKEKLYRVITDHHRTFWRRNAYSGHVTNFETAQVGIYVLLNKAW